jgi:cytoskeletal protein CcmA (bactofilin family)
MSTENKKDDKMVSFISENIYINGDISSENGIIDICARIDSNCIIKKMIIRASGQVNGSVKSTDLRLFGTINGDVTVDTLHIATTGVVNGNVDYKYLSIEAGGTINGSCKKIKNE